MIFRVVSQPDTLLPAPKGFEKIYEDNEPILRMMVSIQELSPPCDESLNILDGQDTQVLRGVRDEAGKQ